MIPNHYSLSDIAALSVGYLKGYPTYVGNNENGIVVLGFSKDSFWKHMRASWDYSLIRDLPYIFLKILLINLVLILAIYMLVNGKLLKSVQPMIKGIQNLSAGEPVHIPETGVLSEICTNINRASVQCPQQPMFLCSQRNMHTTFNHFRPGKINLTVLQLHQRIFIFITSSQNGHDTK